MHAAAHWPALELREGRHISRILRAQCLHANNNPAWFLQLRLRKFPPDVPHAREGMRTSRVCLGRRRVKVILRLLPQPYCDEAAEAAQEGLRLHVAQHVDGRRAQRLVLVRCLRQSRKGLLALGAAKRGTRKRSVPGGRRSWHPGSAKQGMRGSHLGPWHTARICSSKPDECAIAHELRLRNTGPARTPMACGKSAHGAGAHPLVCQDGAHQLGVRASHT